MFDAKRLLDMLMSAQGTPNAPGGPQAGTGSGGLGGLMGQVMGHAQPGGGARMPSANNPGQGTGLTSASGALAGIGGLVGAVLQQVTQATQQGTGQASQSTASALGALKGKPTAEQAAEVFGRVRELAGQNKLATGAVIGSLAGLLLGTKTGRGLAGSAAQLGGLALIGGLAYKAYANYQAGQPLMTGVPGLGDIATAPVGSGFEPAAQSNDSATALLRAMIAAAAADGVIDEAERAAILGGLKQMGLETEAAEFLEQELSNPAGVDDLVASVSGPEASSQLYTAARLAIDPDTHAEQVFLQSLAQGLGLDAELVANIEAAAAQVRAG